MRRAGRVTALQLLYQLDATSAYDALEEAFALHFEHLVPEVSAESRRFAEELCRGIVLRLTELDERIERASDNWRLERMSRVDRSILRLATHELSCPELGTPPRVAVSEAVELATEFGTSESGSFINGVLSRIARDLHLDVV
jgi:transcription antitermination protein NusB